MGGGGVALTSITIDTNVSSLLIGQNLQLTATGHYSDGSTINLTSGVTWGSNDHSVCTVTSGSAGGILTGVGVGATPVSATLGLVSSSAAATVVGSLTRASGPIPDATTAFGGTPAVLSYAIKVPADASMFTLKLSNRTGIANGVGSSITSNIAVYQSDGTGRPMGASLGTFLAQTVPGDGTELSLGPMAVTRGTDGCIVVVYSVPANANICQAQFQTWGAYVQGTSTVDPSPGGWNNYSLGLLWIVPQFITGTRRFVVLGDSISVGASVTAPPGFLLSAWNNVAKDKGYSMSIFGMSGSKLSEWADLSTYPALWVDETFSKADLYVELGVNDLAGRSGAQMYADLTTIVNRAKAAGCVRVYANTIAPDAAFINNDAERINYNSLLRTNSLGLTGIVDLAKPQASGGMASNGDPTVLYAPFDTGDGLHWNALGHVQAAAAIEATIG